MTRKKLYAFRLALVFTSLALVASAAPPTFAQRYGALERGYRTGYSDGYQAGWGDQLKRARPDYRGKEDYRRADRAYIAAYGEREDYRDGYQQGYEVGYDAGYARRGFNSSLPSGLRRRGAVSYNDAGDDATNDANTSDSRVARNRDDDGGRYSPATTDANSIQSGAVLLVELMNRLSTDVSQRGDRFEARVVEPQEFEGAIVSGRVAEVERPGKTRGTAHLQLRFDQIRLPGGDWTEFSAQVVEVIEMGDVEVGEVDSEGGIRGKDSTKDDVAKVGASAGIGAIIGGIAGGAKGAGIGAIIGGAAGTAGVMTDRGKEIRFEPGQQLRIRSTGRGR